MNKKTFFILAAVCVLALVSVGCTKKEQQRAQERTSDAVNDAFDATTDVLRNVASGVNNAVYHK